VSRVSRRAILAATASTVAMAGLLAPVVTVPSVDRLVALARRRSALLLAFKGVEDDAAFNRIGRAVCGIEQEMIATPATTPEGFRAKLAVLREYYGDELGPGLDGGMQASVLADAEAMADTGA